ncbi:CoA-disulfide reductase [Acidianus sulfidivorans JP7]|uniref:CoA-disulfide reductase n=1 Tax=Acidianus sulfidivorans JP7 TaxID=619593 RepID=A0A2U9ILX8_9CREN|nr:FAD-dependent oxidoreductase [Acidianus sulfidivorans]AWR97010.1 CoA-disulfide reductase [Acidianus sulfidivorans JP7]
MDRVIVVGGGAAGMSASSRVRKLNPNADITVFEETKMVSHAPCGVPYFIEGLFNDENLFMTYTPEFFITKRKINVKINNKVDEIDLNARTVKVTDQNNNKSVLEYDYLVLTLGSIPKKVPFEGKRIFYAHHPAHAVELRKEIWNLDKIAIIGGGILGVELAEALSNRNKDVILIHRGNYILNRMLDEDMGKIIQDRMQKDIKLKTDEALQELQDDGRIVITDKGKYEVDGTIVAIGVTPNISLIKDKIKIGKTGAIWTDEYMRTNFHEVFAAGDVAETTNIVTKDRTWMPFAPVANKMGYVAGSNIAGKSMIFPGTVGTMITKYKEFYIAKTGIAEFEAKHYGIKTYSAMIKSKTRARYYPDAKDIYVKLIAEESTNKIVGAQIIGGEEVLGRIDMLAAMIMKGFTVEESFFVEMGYLPAIATVWDPVIVAIRQLMKAE